MAKLREPREKHANCARRGVAKMSRKMLGKIGEIVGFSRAKPRELEKTLEQKIVVRVSTIFKTFLHRGGPRSFATKYSTPNPERRYFKSL